MSKSILTPVPAKVVRQAAREGRFTVPEAAKACVFGGPQGRGRGRLNPSLVAAFNEAMASEGVVYAGEKTAVEGRQVTLPLTKMNAAGARLKRPESLPVSEVRRLAGAEGKRGRLSKADIAKATEAVESARGWNVKPERKAKAKG